MEKALLTRLLDTLIVLLGVSTLVFLLLSLVPGDPVDVILGESAQPADRHAMREALGLNQSLPRRWWNFQTGLLQGDLGESIIRKRPVADLLTERLPSTLKLAFCAFMVILCIAFPLGVLAARRKGHWQDGLATGLSLLGLSIPNFWLGPLLVLLFSIYLGWLPVSGMEQTGSIILPALTLGASLAAVSMRMIRASLLEVMQLAYMRTARAKGLSEARATWRHALPNAMLPVLVLLGLQLAGLLAGTVITEVIFAWPGIGSLLIEAIQQRDYPLVQGVVLVIAVLYVLINFMTDLAVRMLDPRISAI